MDKLINTLAGFGPSGLIFFYVVTTSGYAGAAAYTFALSAIGPGGMIGGLISLGFVSLISAVIAEFGFDKVNEGMINEFRSRGWSKEDLLTWIDNRWLFPKKKAQFHSYVNEHFN